MSRSAQQLAAGLGDGLVRQAQQDRRALIGLAPGVDELRGRVDLVRQDPGEQSGRLLGGQLLDQAVGITVGRANLIGQLGQLAGGAFEALG